MSRFERRIAFISAITLLFSTLEFLIPKPLPFLRLGLANLPLLIIIQSIDLRSFFVILVMKALGQGMVSGTLFSYLILVSLAGTLSSGLAMYGLARLLKERVSLVGISLVGAFVSNLSQIAVAALLVYGRAIWIAAPVMLSLGLATSLVLGFLAQRYKTHSSFAQRLTQDEVELGLPSLYESRHYPVASVTALLSIAAIIVVRDLWPLVATVLLMYAMQLACRRRVRITPALMLLLSLVLLSFLEPNGRVLLVLGKFALTEGALEVALIKGLRLIALLSASQALVGTNPPLRGRAGRLVVLTLAYFSALLTSFKERTGSLVERIDQALQAAAGESGGPLSSPQETKTIHSSLVVAIGLGVIAISVFSRLDVLYKTPLFA
ncbi:MAG: heptaprenyl diphosphate synthase [Spirochaetales bacterium]|nr:heptaprenyl diphosphate synthase [Spirochaetales bacterium]